MEVEGEMEVQEHEEVAHVRFPEEQTLRHDSEIVVQNETDDIISAHLGFLQIHHHYEIKLTIDDPLGEDLTSDPLQNLHVKVAGVMPCESGKGHEVTLNFHAYKEKLVREEVVLTDAADRERKLTLVLHARVLGRGKGTPALKTGIHCTSIDSEYDSEQSDWQGFD